MGVPGIFFCFCVGQTSNDEFASIYGGAECGSGRLKRKYIRAPTVSLIQIKSINYPGRGRSVGFRWALGTTAMATSTTTTTWVHVQ